MTTMTMKSLHIHLHPLSDGGAVMATKWLKAYLSQPRAMSDVDRKQHERLQDHEQPRWRSAP